MKNELVFLLLGLPFIHAQRENSENASMTAISSALPTAPSSASDSIHAVNVGEDGITFDPDTLTVSTGDKVEFHFDPQSHSVAQVSFDNPGHPSNTFGFSSGRCSTTEESVSHDQPARSGRH